MDSTPQLQPSSTVPPVEEFLESIIGPLLDHCRLGQPGLGIACYDGDRLDVRWKPAIDEQSYGAEHPRVAIRLNNLAQLLQATNRLAETEPLMRRALDIVRKNLGDEHPSSITVRRNYESLLAEMKSVPG